MRLRLSLALVLLSSLAAQSVRAQAATVLAFRTPSGNIGCVYSGGSAGKRPELRCDILSGLRPPPRRPAGCGLDYGDSLELSEIGRPSPVCHGDTAIDPRAPVLAYGRTWRRSGLDCTSRSVGLRCSNRSGHGFFLSRQSSKTF